MDEGGPECDRNKPWSNTTRAGAAGGHS